MSVAHWAVLTVVLTAQHLVGWWAGKKGKSSVDYWGCWTVDLMDSWKAEWKVEQTASY